MLRALNWDVNPCLPLQVTEMFLRLVFEDLRDRFGEEFISTIPFEGYRMWIDSIMAIVIKGTPFSLIDRRIK